ncbi:hypothetical protein FIU90_14385 [Erythrobacter sp. THAF29]|nr:hypothetical protein FIU90_14385 [Erythrobacter sp. THAF29]
MACHRSVLRPPTIPASPADHSYRMNLRLTLMAPALQHDALQGHHPSILTLQALINIDIPDCRIAQKRVLVRNSADNAGFNASHFLVRFKSRAAPRD